MKVRKLLAMLLISSTAILTVACGSNSASTSSQSNNTTPKKAIKDGGNFIFNISMEPDVLNPLYGHDRVTMTMNNALFAPLCYMDKDNLQYVLAEDIKHSNDFLTYTVKLKKDLKWHDGKPLTSDDLIFTVNKILDEKQNAIMRSSFVIDNKAVKVKKIDDRTVEFKLPTINIPFMRTIAQICPIPKHVFEGEKDLQKSVKNENPIGSGAFKYKESKKGESITLERFDDYAGGKPHLDTITYRLSADPNSAGAALKNGEISANYIGMQKINDYKKTGKLKIIPYYEGLVDNFAFNCQSPKLSKKEVRQAIAYALNKKDIIKAAYGGEKYAPKAYSPIAKNTLYYTDDVAKYELNKDKSKELLKKAGVKDLKLNVVYISDSKPSENEVLVLKDNLKEVGIDVELKPMEESAFNQQLDISSHAEFDIICNAYLCDTDPDAFKQVFMTGETLNTARYINKETDKLWNKGIVETDKVKREKIYKDIQKKLVEELPVYPICYYDAIIAVNKNVGGIEEAKVVPIYMFQDLSKLYMKEK